MKLTIKRLFSCGEDVLYLVAIAAYVLLRRYLPQFSAFNSTYDTAFVDDAEKAVANAEAMPDVSDRDSELDIKTRQVKAAEKAYRKKSQSLKRYIKRSFKKADVPAMLAAAGFNFYGQRSKVVTAMRDMIKASNNFIIKYSTELSTGGMPAGFKQEIADAGTAYNDRVKEHNDLELAIETQAADKLNANNAIYETLIAVLQDAQEALAEVNLKKQMTFAHLKRVVQGNRVAGFKGYATTEDGLLLEGVSVVSSDLKYQTTTGKDGKYVFARIAAGTYRFTISMQGYAPIEVEVTIKPGIKKHLNFTLVKEVMEQAA